MHRHVGYQAILLHLRPHDWPHLGANNLVEEVVVGTAGNAVEAGVTAHGPHRVARGIAVSVLAGESQGVLGKIPDRGKITLRHRHMSIVDGWFHRYAQCNHDGIDWSNHDADALTDKHSGGGLCAQ